MELARMLKKYGQYYDAIQKIGSFPFSESLRLDKLDLPKALIQKGYRDLRKDKFEGTLIDYLQWISFLYQTHQVKTYLEQVSRATNQKAKESSDIFKIQEDLVFMFSCLTGWAIEARLEASEKYPTYVNFFRFFISNPDQFFSLVVPHEYLNDEFVLVVRAICVGYVSEFWYILQKPVCSEGEPGQRIAWNLGRAFRDGLLGVIDRYKSGEPYSTWD